MLNFVFDQNALAHLFDRDDFALIKEKVIESQERRINRLFLSEVNVAESLLNLQEPALGMRQNFVRQAWELCGKGLLLSHPNLHLQRSIAAVSEEKYRSKLRELRDTVRKFCETSNWSDCLLQFGEWQAIVGKSNEELVNFYKESTQKLIERKHSRSYSIETRFNKRRNPQYFKMFYPILLERFGLSQHCSDWPVEKVANQMTSLYTYCIVYLVRVLERVFDRHAVLPSDTFDLEYVIYLDMCDYFVTDDEDIHRYFKCAGPAYCYGRAISLEKFLEHVQRPFLIGQIISPKYVDSKTDAL